MNESSGLWFHLRHDHGLGEDEVRHVQCLRNDVAERKLPNTSELDVRDDKVAAEHDDGVAEDEKSCQ